MIQNLETDLSDSDVIITRVESDDEYAYKLYRALCNNTWRHIASGSEWDCTWRYAAELVSDLGGEDGYYCSGDEGLIDEQILDDLHSIGWVPAT